jgi:L-ascorbate metabolism protein UlaG (beta-lactamase superfamily)
MAKVRIRWYGQSTFLISGERSVFIDPFGAMDGLAERGLRFDYPPIENVEADVLLVTHEHADHNVVEVVGGSPETLDCGHLRDAGRRGDRRRLRAR